MKLRSANANFIQFYLRYMRSIRGSNRPGGVSPDATRRYASRHPASRFAAADE